MIRARWIAPLGFTAFALGMKAVEAPVDKYEPLLWFILGIGK